MSENGKVHTTMINDKKVRMIAQQPLAQSPSLLLLSVEIKCETCGQNFNINMIFGVDILINYKGYELEVDILLCDFDIKQFLKQPTQSGKVVRKRARWSFRAMIVLQQILIKPPWSLKLKIL